MAIIKCPECNHEVSDQAAHCPFCGVDIAGNLVSCPDCGKILLKSVKACPNCGCDLTCISQNENPIKNHQIPREEKTMPKRHTRTSSGNDGENGKKIKTLLLVLFIIILAIGGFFYMKHRSYTNALNSEYAMLTNDYNASDYAAFLKKYPNCKYYTDIKTRMDQLLKVQAEWNQIAMSSSKDDFVRFSQQNHNSQFDALCKQKIDSLDWIDASTENTQESYLQYISLHPQGKYLDLCNKSKEELDKLTVSNQDKDAVRSTINRYFAALSQNNTDELGQLVVERMYNQSLSLVNVTNPVTYSVTSRINVSKMPSSNGEFFNFVAKYKVLKQSIENGENKSTVYICSSVINPDMKLVSIHLNASPSPEQQ